MALKGDRNVVNGGYDISFFMNVVAEKGLIVVHDGGGSGAAMDQSAAVVAIPTGGVSGTRPAGLLLNDVVDIDLTRQHLNQHKDEVQVESKVTLCTQGWVVTDQVVGSPAAGDKAYYDSAGQLRPTDPTNGVVVGKFLSAKDEDGYAKVYINITG